MASNVLHEAGSLFRIRRPPTTTNGFISDVDATVNTHLDELNKLLGKRIFDPDGGAVGDGGAIGAPAPQQGLVPAQVLRAELTPKRIFGNATWEPDSLADRFRDAQEDPDNITLGEYVDRTADLSALKYAFDDLLQTQWLTLDYNTKAVLDEGYPKIRDYLVAFAYLVMDLEEVNGLKNFLLNSRRGVASVVDYAIVSAARTIIHKKALIVPDYNDDDSPIVNAVKAANLSLSSISFEPALLTLVDDHIFNSKEAKLIEGAKIGPIPAAMKPQLVKYIKLSPIPITKDNVNFFLPLFISQIKGTGTVKDDTPVSLDESEKDFDVEFFEDDRSMIQVSRSAVKCAAQLYYGMVVGDELDVFSVVNYFTHKYLLRGGIEILDSRLRDDLQTYVFSNRFTDLKSGRVVDRTRPAERQMFYRQTFDSGNAQVADDVIVNEEFPRLWKILILESAQYLERAQASPHPDSFVSRQKVMQAVEDIQYNLSTHCTGMANVITPLIYAELNFVIQRILMHAEVLKQVVPVGGTWWRVVERLYMEMRHARPKATALYNKAKLGHDIINSIANYNPATFEDDTHFSAFISDVDAFITTQSILQEALTDDLKRDQEEGPGTKERATVAPELVSALPTPNGKPSTDEWDF
jgi:hypothetical protein